jgi:arylsulfatase A
MTIIAYFVCLSSFAAFVVAGHAAAEPMLAALDGDSVVSVLVYSPTRKQVLRFGGNKSKNEVRTFVADSGKWTNGSSPTAGGVGGNCYGRQTHARPLGRVRSSATPAGKTQIPQSTLDHLHARVDLTYAMYGDRTLQMDVYRPKGACGKLPAVVCIHGGGWAKGNRSSHGKIAQALAHRGYVAATISYRLSGEAHFPAAIQDCKAAVRFLRANAKEFGIEAGKIGAIGLSAGGHLTALLATSHGVRELEGKGGNSEFSSEIQAAVPMGAQTDLTSDRTREVSKERLIWKQFLNGSQEEQPESYRLASPLHHLDKNDPPCWFITGEKDDESTRAEKIRKRMQELGVRSGLSVIEGAPHGFSVKQVWFDQMIEATDHFFTRVLKRDFKKPSQ